MCNYFVTLLTVKLSVNHMPVSHPADVICLVGRSLEAFQLLRFVLYEEKLPNKKPFKGRSVVKYQ